MLLTHLSQRWDHSRIAPGKSPVCFVPSMTWTCSHQVYIFSLANVESCVLGWPFAPTRPELNSTTVHPAVSTRKVGSSRKQYWPWPLDSAQQHYVRDRKSGCMNLLIREAIELHPNHTNFLQWRKQKTFSKNWALLNLNPLAPNCIYIYIYIYIYTSVHRRQCWRAQERNRVHLMLHFFHISHHLWAWEGQFISVENLLPFPFS